MADIFDEVEEGLRKDKYEDWLRKWWPAAAAGVAAIVLGTAGYQGWDAWRTSRIHAASNEYLDAQQDWQVGLGAVAADRFSELADGAGEGYAALSLINRAAIAQEAGDNAAAADFFEQAAEATNEPVLRDMATLKAIWARWDELSLAEIQLRGDRLLSSSSPYRDVMRETVALAAMRDGELDVAETEYRLLADTGTAAGVQAGVQFRAEQALAVIAQRRANAPDPAEAAETPVEESAEDSVGADAPEDDAETPAEDAPAVENEEPAGETDGGEE